MTRTLFDHTDSYRDTLTVYYRGSEVEPISITLNAERSNELTVILTPAAVEGLRAALAPYDRARAAWTVGRDYGLLPNSTYRDCGRSYTSSLARCGVTRVTVADGPDDDGDYLVTALDGTSAKTGGYSVDPRFLVELESEPPAEVMTPEDAVRSLDPRRLAALVVSTELIKTSGTIANARDIRDLAGYILGEEVAA